MIFIKAAFLFAGYSVSAHSHPSNHQRRRLTPDMNIIDALHHELAIGNDHPRFTFTAERGGDGLFTSSKPLEIDVVLTDPSIGENTSFSDDGGPSKLIQSASKFFIMDQVSDDDLKHFAILNVDEDKGLVSGLIQKEGKLFKLEQYQDKPAVAKEVENFDPPKDWTCTTVGDEHVTVATEDPPVDDSNITRRLTKDHSGHDDQHSHDHAHKHHHVGNLGSTSKSIFSQVSGINPSILKNRRRMYATDDYPKKWSYQVDLYIEIDMALVNKHDTDTVNMPNTINYVNALITAASSVYEKEVDTHLHVMHISRTTIYDAAGSTSTALNTMVNRYSGSNWHYTDPITGETPDLHHAILYTSLGGGIAYLSAVCNPTWGYVQMNIYAK